MPEYIDIGDDKIRSAAQAKLVSASFARVFLRKGELVSRFYYHLFSERPEVEGLFQNDFGAQKELFSAMLVMVVKRLTQPGEFEYLAKRLQRQHGSLDLSRGQWKSVSNSLIFALREVLQGDLSPEEDAAWSATTTQLILAISALKDKPDGPLPMGGE